MPHSIKKIVLDDLKKQTTLKKPVAQWHVALVGALSIGVPLFIGYFCDNMPFGLLAALGGRTCLYLRHEQPLLARMRSLLLASCGFLIAFAVGLSFSFNPLVSSIALGLWATLVHATVLCFKVKPPGSFFFIMIAAMASSMPFNLSATPERIFIMALGCISTAAISLSYNWMVGRNREKPDPIPTPLSIDREAHLSIALIMGLFMFISMLLGFLIRVKNPYWIPISCAAIMQGLSLSYTWQRSFQRVAGTLIGMALCWVILLGGLTPLKICIYLVLLQFAIETLLSRNYGLAIIFVTPLAILLTAVKLDTSDPSAFMLIRFIDCMIGTVLGLLGGFLIHGKQALNSRNKS